MFEILILLCYLFITGLVIIMMTNSHFKELHKRLDKFEKQNKKEDKNV